MPSVFPRNSKSLSSFWILMFFVLSVKWLPINSVTTCSLLLIFWHWAIWRLFPRLNFLRWFEHLFVYTCIFPKKNSYRLSFCKEISQGPQKSEKCSQKNNGILAHLTGCHVLSRLTLSLLRDPMTSPNTQVGYLVLLFLKSCVFGLTLPEVSQRLYMNLSFLAKSITLIKHHKVFKVGHESVWSMDKWNVAGAFYSLRSTRENLENYSSKFLRRTLSFNLTRMLLDDGQVRPHLSFPPGSAELSESTAESLVDLGVEFANTGPTGPQLS